jgi:hypothetical protein
MSITDRQPDKNADRVVGHKWVFTTARTISPGAGYTENTAPYFWRSDAITLSKYSLQAIHHCLTLRIVLFSQGTSSSSPLMIFSIVPVQCRLYGITISGSSWCMQLHPSQRSRRMISLTVNPLVSIYLRCRTPYAFNSPPHSGQACFSSLHM